MRPLRNSLFPLVFAFIVFSCQEDVFQKPESVDPDMVRATDLAEDYLSSTHGRFENSKYSITVLKYENDLLLFDTNTDTIVGYQEVQEESVTAIVPSGNYIFWFAGNGLEKLEGIEFDSTAQEVLKDLPEDFFAEQMWVLKIPNRYKEDRALLKYDIVYIRDGGIQVRLDPKIQIQN